MNHRTLISAATVFAISACAGSADDSRFDPSKYDSAYSRGYEIRLVDAPTSEVTEIVVTISSVEAHVAGNGWLTVGGAGRIDLLKLQGGSYASLGVATLPVGNITQLRLIVDEAGDNHVTTPDGAQHPLTVPSGPQSGIKIKLGYDVSPCASGVITLDFDGKKSIFTHPKGAGAGDEWLLRPVVRVKSVRSDTANCDSPPDMIPVPELPPVEGGTPIDLPVEQGEPTTCGGEDCSYGTCVDDVCHRLF